jgi:hypothetical protein
LGILERRERNTENKLPQFTVNKQLRNFQYAVHIPYMHIDHIFSYATPVRREPASFRTDFTVLQQVNKQNKNAEIEERCAGDLKNIPEYWSFLSGTAL